MDWITTSTLLRDLEDFENQAAWRRFADRFAEPVRRFARRYGVSADDAEDVAQETLATFARAFAEGAYHREQGRLSSWLFGIARNHIRSHRRRVQRGGPGVPVDTDGVPAWERIPDPRVRDLWNQVWEEHVARICLERAREEFQPEVFARYECVVSGDRSPAEVARDLNVPVKAVYNARHRVTRRLRELRQDLETVPPPTAPSAADPSPPPLADPVAPDTLGRYRLVRELARGGMGIVYEAHDPQLDRRIAIKVLRAAPQTDDSGAERLRDEARALAAIAHPNIAAVYSLEDEDGRWFLTMERVTGETLRERLRRGPLGLDDALGITRQVALALGAAHDRQVVHRDLKPANIMLDASGRVRVLDFGLALVSHARTQGGAGTPGYMSPEQIQGRAQDHRVDVWAFGCVLAECLLGRPVFGAVEPADRIRLSLSGSPLLHWPAAIPPEVRDLVDRCLEQDPEARPKTLAEARAVVEQAMLSRSAPPEPAGMADSPNLPARRTGMIGRREELDRIGERLGERRLITLVGPGGCGKSRLALEAGYEFAARFPEGVHWIGVSGLDGEDRLRARVAALLGIRPRDDRDFMASLRARRTGRVLLVFDNCEAHLEAVAGVVDSVLDAARHCRVLATSRRPLRLSGEVQIQLGPLSVPGPDTTDVARVLEADAIRLFVDRARDVLPEFEIRPDNASAVTRICQLADGIPLALELAAAQIRVSPPEELARLLEVDFGVLQGSRDGPEHHRTLTALVAWSVDRLSVEARDLFVRLAVFSGGWSLEAAELVIADSRVPSWTFMERMNELAEHSLLVLVRGNGGVRYRMLEPVRMYAAGLLESRDQGETVQKRHRDVFVGLAERHAARLRERDHKQALVALAADYDNITQALETSLELGEAEPALRLSAALGRYWGYRGHWKEGAEYLRRSLALPLPVSLTNLRVPALNWAGNLAQYCGDVPGAEALYADCLDLSRKVKDRWYEASARNNLGVLANQRGALESARDHHQASLALRQGLDDPWAVALSRHHLGLGWMHRGDWKAGRRELRAALDGWTRGGDSTNAGIAMAGLGRLERLAGNPSAARQHLDSAVAAQENGGDRWALAMALHHLARLQMDEGDLTPARSHLMRAMVIRRDQNDLPGVSQSLDGLARVEILGGDPHRAFRFLRAADQLLANLGTARPPDEQEEYQDVSGRIRLALEEAVRNAPMAAEDHWETVLQSLDPPSRPSDSR